MGLLLDLPLAEGADEHSAIAYSVGFRPLSVETDTLSADEDQEREQRLTDLGYGD